MIQRIRFRDGRVLDRDHGPGIVVRGPAHGEDVRHVAQRGDRDIPEFRWKPGKAIKWR